MSSLLASSIIFLERTAFPFRQPSSRLLSTNARRGHPTPRGFRWNILGGEGPGLRVCVEIAHATVDSIHCTFARFLVFQIRSSSYPFLMLLIFTLIVGLRLDMLVGECVGIMCARGYFVSLVPFDVWLPTMESSALCRAWYNLIGAYIPNAERSAVPRASVDHP